jgi:hypothetical protein
MGVLLFKGGVGVGMLKWQTSDLSHCVGEESRVFPPLPRGGRGEHKGEGQKTRRHPHAVNRSDVPLSGRGLGRGGLGGGCCVGLCADRFSLYI